MKEVFQSFDSKELEALALYLADAGIHGEVQVYDEDGLTNGHLFVKEEDFEHAADIVEAIEEKRLEALNSENCPKCGKSNRRITTKTTNGIFVNEIAIYECESCGHGYSTYVS